MINLGKVIYKWQKGKVKQDPNLEEQKKKQHGRLKLLIKDPRKALNPSLYQIGSNASGKSALEINSQLPKVNMQYR